MLNLHWGQFKAFLIFATLMVVFGFARQKIRVVFEGTNQGLVWRFNANIFFFKFVKLLFYNTCFIILNKNIHKTVNERNHKRRHNCYTSNIMQVTEFEIPFLSNMNRTNKANHLLEQTAEMKEDFSLKLNNSQTITWSRL